MKKYEGLCIPKIGKTTSLKRKQELRCQISSCNSSKVKCESCLFYPNNLEKFKRWHISQIEQNIDKKHRHVTIPRVDLTEYKKMQDAIIKEFIEDIKKLIK